MTYFFQSLLTRSFWRHALLSAEGAASFFSALGVMYLFIEMLDTFNIYTKSNYSHLAIIPIILVALLYTVTVARRPLGRFCYKVPGRDLSIEVKIGDLFSEPGDVVISTNTTFDTALTDDLISAGSLQGQLALTVFKGNTAEMDRQLDIDLANVPYRERQKKGKTREYEIGTVARVKTSERTFYFVAMARLNDHLTSVSSLRMIEDALTGLWGFVRDQGEFRPIVMPVMGTGRGRVDVPRKKMVERIAQSFADFSKDRTFCNRLTIMIHPGDAKYFGVNLFEIRDYLGRSLHI
jgi:hypothetical protein